LPPTSFDDTPFAATPGGVRVAIRLTPRAWADRLEGIVRAADGAPLLKASVTAPPAEGRANHALLGLLAKNWGVPRRDLAIVGGAKSRNKTVHVAGDPAGLLKRLRSLLAALPTS
jgi:uncharacterized protein (TIGR00251 family)